MHRALGGGGGDPAQAMWFFAWVPHAISHGQDPFLSTAMGYPHGINLMWNTGMSLIGLVMAPVTVLGSPVLTFGIVALLGPVLTAWTTMLWLRRHAEHWASAIVGGGLVGFSPYMVGHSLGQVNLTFLPLLPVLLILTEDLLWRRPRPVLSTGWRLGIVAAAQVLISEEMLLILLIGIFLVLIAAAAWRSPREVIEALRSALPGLGVAVVVALVLVGYPLLTQLFGPQYPTGVEAVAEGWQSSPKDWVIPTTTMLFSSRSAAAGLGRNAAEISGYIGLPLLLLLGVAVVRLRRDVRTRIATSVALGATWLSLGRVRAGVPQPWDLFAQLPGVQDILAIRLSLLATLGMSLVVVQSVDAILASSRPRRRLGLVALGLACLPLLPVAEPAGAKVAVPRFFADGAKGLARDAPVVLLPFPTKDDSAVLLWQAVTHFRFRLFGGYALHAPSSGASTYSITAPTAVSSVAVDLGAGRTPGPARMAVFRRSGVRYVVMVDGAVDPGAAAAVTASIGHGPDSVSGGVRVWSLDLG